MIQKEIKVYGKVTLHGTLTFPDPDKTKNDLPALLILPGTGEIDRNGNAKRGKLKLNIYRDLAAFMTTLGFVTLRYDKRGVGESDGKTYETGMVDLVDDAEAAVQFLKNNEKVNPEKIFVLGHSEGAILATMLQTRIELAGIILLSGAGKTLDEALTYQQQLLYKELNSATGFKGFLIKKLKVVNKIKKKNKKMFDKILNSDKDTMRINGVRISSKWFKEHFTYDLFNDYKKITCPVLAITGEKDIQANAHSLNILHDYIQSPLETYVILRMNHGLKEQESEPSILKAKKQYVDDMEKPIHADLKDKLANWVKKYAF